MALVVDKTGKITEKHLAASIDIIKNILEKNKDFDIQKVLQASKVKIERIIV
jgi:hypothetical protein